MGLSTPTEILLAGAVSGAVEGPVLSYIENQGNRAISRFEQGSLHRNAVLLKRGARERIREGKRESLKAIQRGRQVAGAQRAAFASAGIDPNSGTAALLQEETIAASREDAVTLEINAFREGLGMEMQASEQETRKRFIRKDQRAAARLTAATGGLRFARRVQEAEFEADKRG